MLYVESRKSFKVRREKKLFAECQIVTLGKHISLSSARQLHYSANIFLCRVPSFAECFFSSLPSVELCRVFFASFAECIYFTECFFRSTRQRACLPSVRGNALDKHKNTRQRVGLRQWGLTLKHRCLTLTNE